MTRAFSAAAAVAERVLVGAFFLRPGVFNNSITGLQGHGQRSYF